MILKKSLVFETWEIYQQVNRKEYKQNSLREPKKLNTEKQELPNRTETHDYENWSTTILKYHKTNVNTRLQYKCKVNKENHDWKEDY